VCGGDRRDSLRERGEACKDAGLRGMGVEEVEAVPAKKLGKAAQGADVVDGVGVAGPEGQPHHRHAGRFELLIHDS
jgi:hypothetical protein